MTNYERVIREMCDAIIEKAQQNLGAFRSIRGKRRRRVSSGLLKKSLDYKLRMASAGPSVKFGAKGKAGQYFDVIEQGRRPNKRMPPVDAIMRWIDEKPVRLQKKGGGFIKATPQAKRAAAYLIARSIAKKGIEGIYYYEEAIKQVIEDFGPKLQEAMQKDIDNAVKFDA
jgi:hypothetical protein